MARPILVRTLLLPLSASLAQSGEAPQKPITSTDDVVAMVKTGLPEDAIIASIRGRPTSSTTYPLAIMPEDLKARGSTPPLRTAFSSSLRIRNAVGQ